MCAYLFEQIGIYFHRWCAAFSHFENSRGQFFNSRERVGLNLLRIHKLHMTMYYQYAKESEAAALTNKAPSFSWDDYNVQFAEIVSLAASVANMTYDNDSPVSESSTNPFFDIGLQGAPIRPLFCLDNGLIGPLFEVATLCRDPVIRRSAVQVLRSAPRQEGVFNSHLCAMVAEKVIAIEEAAASGDVLDYHAIVTGTEVVNQKNTITKSSEVPDTARLTYAFPKFDMDKKKIFLTLGQPMKEDIKIAWPDINFLVDARR